MLILVGVGVTVYYFYNDTLQQSSLGNFWGGFLGGSLGYTLSYWGNKSNILESEQINGEYAIRIWQYIVIAFALFSIGFQILYIQQIFVGVKPAFIFFFIWAIVNGNFKPTIEPNYETISVYMDDAEINKKSKRFTGKYLVFGGLIGMIVMLILPEGFAIYLFGSYFLGSVAIQYFYAKYLFKQKYA
jgi:hypothetical protein